MDNVVSARIAGLVELCSQLDEQAVDFLAGGQAELDALRDLYKVRPEDFSAQDLGMLKTVAGQLAEAGSARVAQLLGAYMQLCADIERLVTQREAVRALIKAGMLHDHADRLEVNGVSAVLLETETLNFPAANTKARQRLDEMLHGAGCWDHVSILSAPRLTKFRKEGMPQELRARIEGEFGMTHKQILQVKLLGERKVQTP